MRTTEKLLITATAALLTASVIGIAIVRSDDKGDGRAATTTTIPEVTTTTAPPLADGLDGETTTTTSTDSTANSIAPVGATTTTRGGRTTTTAKSSGGDARSSTNTAPCPSGTAQPVAGPVAADGVSSVVVGTGATRAITTTGHEPSWRPGADQILHVQTASGRDPGMCLTAPDGTNPQAVSTPVGAAGPVVSPDGTKVAVRSGVGGARVSLIVGPLDTTSRKSILTGTDITAPTWLGNGTIVACFTPTGGGPRIVKLPATGGSPVKVLDGCSGPPSGSSDGSRIAITSPTGIDVIENDGRVTTLDRTGLLSQPPAWSPGSDKVAYAYTDANGRELGVLDLGKNSASQVARAEADFPAFSPNGDRIAFTGRTGGTGPRQVATVGATGGTVKVVANCAGRCVLPQSAWSPDGTAVVVDSTPGS